MEENRTTPEVFEENTDILDTNNLDDEIEISEDDIENLTGLERVKSILKKNEIPFEDSRVEELYNEISSHSKMELVKDKREIKNMIDLLPVLEGMVENYKTIEKTAETSMKPVELLDEITKTASDKLHDDSSEEEGTTAKKIITDLKSKSSESEDEEDNTSVEDIEKMIEDMRTDIKINLVILRECIGDYNNTHGKTNIYDDIIEQLIKDKTTLEASSDINAPLKIEYLTKALESIQTKKFDQYKMMIPKVQNVKNLKSLSKEYFNPNKSKLSTKVGFIKEYLDIFTIFFLEETEFRSIYSLKDWGVNKDSIPVVCGLFAYHLAKVIESERRHQNYKAILFKLIFFNIISIETAIPVNKKQFERFTDEAREHETENSAIRSFFYDEYMRLFENYFKALGLEYSVKS